MLNVVNDKTSIATFWLGSGNASDVMMSFVADVCGEANEEGKSPKHAHVFGLTHAECLLNQQGNEPQ